MDNKKLTIKDSSLSFFIGFLLCQLGVVIVSFIGIFVCSILKLNIEYLETFLNTASGYLLCALGMDIVMVLVFLFFNKGKENKVFSKPSPKKSLIYILIAIASFFCLYPVITCVDSLFVKLGIELNTIPYEINTKNYFISLISLVILPAVCEELLFRGLIFKGLKPYGKIFSITISALMFALFHMSIDQLIYPILMGLLLSYIMHKENNLFYCILVHGINNFLSLTLAYLNINLVFNHWTYILLAIILGIIFLTCILYFVIKDHKNQEKLKLTKTDKFYLFVSIGVMILLWIIINLNK